MNATEKIALVRGSILGAIAAGSAYFATLATLGATGEPLAGMDFALSAIPAGAAFFATMGARYGEAIAIDNRNALQRATDEQKEGPL